MMAVVGLHLVLNYMDMLSENIMVPLAIGLSWFILVHLGVFCFITIKLATQGWYIGHLLSHRRPSCQVEAC